MFRLLIDLLFPIRSLKGEEGQWITDRERRSLRVFPLRLHRDLLRKRGIKHLDCLIAAGSYDSTPLLKKAILTFKYGRIRALHTDLSALILQALPGLLLPSPHYKKKGFPLVLCPVPLHWTRRFHRGFNQAELLAHDLAKAKGWQTAALLVRRRPTGHQAWRKREERMQSLAGAFRYRGPSPAPRHVVLIDDLFTTGATLDACAKELKEAGVKRVEALVVAYG